MLDSNFRKNIDRFLDLLQPDVPMSPYLYDEYNLSKANDDPAGIYIVYDNGTVRPNILYIGKADKRVKGEGIYNRVKEYVNTGRKILNSHNDPTVALGNHKGGKVLWELPNIENDSNIRVDLFKIKTAVCEDSVNAEFTKIKPNRSTQNVKIAEKIEAILLYEFYNMYGKLPMANKHK